MNTKYIHIGKSTILWEKTSFSRAFKFLKNNSLSRAELSDDNGNVKNIHYGDILIKFSECLYADERNNIYNPQIQISAESETKRSIFREKDKTKRSKKESAQHSKSRNKSFVMTSVSAL